MSIESRRFPYLPLIIQVGERTLSIEAMIDTGFDGDVIVPRDVLGDDLLPDSYSQWRLPNGSVMTAPAYDAVVQIGTLLPVSATMISLGDEALVGRGLIDRYRVTLDRGSRVIIEP